MRTSLLMLVGVAVLAATISVVFVAGLAHPDFLLEVEAVAVIPEE